MDATAWVSLLSMTLVLALIAGRAWKKSSSDFIRYGLIWLVIIAVIALLYQALAPRFLHQEEPGSLPGSQSSGTNL